MMPHPEALQVRQRQMQTIAEPMGPLEHNDSPEEAVGGWYGGHTVMKTSSFRGETGRP